jgi:NAD-dependent protein deacetylase/lipoamidase
MISKRGNEQTGQIVFTSTDSFRALVDMIAGSTRLVALTGAGISTESGIPDYRGPGGVWESGRPPTLADFMKNESSQREYWRLRLERYRTLLDARPNGGHLALTALERQGRLDTIVTQNIDGLHQAAGSNPDRIVELHGSAHRVRCMNCDAVYSGIEIQERQERGDLFPRCLRCGGALRSMTILFGESLPARALARSLAAAQTCDLMLVVGSSLVVNPAAKLPLIARKNGAKLAIINKTVTPLDSLADAATRGASGEVLSAIAEELQSDSSN